MKIGSNIPKPQVQNTEPRTQVQSNSTQQQAPAQRAEVSRDRLADAQRLLGGGTIQTQSSSQTVDGQRRTSTSATIQGSPNLTGGAQLDRTFGRNGQLTNERFQSNIEGRYGNTTLNASRNSEMNRTSQSSSNFDRDAGKWTFNGSSSYSNRTETNRSFQTTSQTRTLGTPEQEAARAQRFEQRSAQMGQVQERLTQLADRFGLRTSTQGSAETGFTRSLGQTQGQVQGRFGTAQGSASAEAFGRANAQGSATIGIDGARAEGSFSAEAGVRAQAQGSAQGAWGTAQGSASAQARVFAEGEGSASLSLNGLQAQGRVGIGAEVSAEVQGSYRSPSVNIGGVPMNVGVDAQGRVAAQVKAEASGSVQITGNPPRIMAEGQAGASAVVKAEGSVRASAGPFSITASGYASAGAEARAQGSIGFNDGKLTIGGGLGAALGVGLGGDVKIEIDVKQIGQAAVGLAQDAGRAAAQGIDRIGNNNGRLDIGDAGAIVQNAGRAIDRGVQAVGNAVQSVGRTVGNAVENAGRAVGNAVENAGRAVGNAISDGAKAVGNFFKNW